ncbi:hypothetical protein [Pasteurella multocida]|uniref:hypothetical protein n=1 Tax=Pasteurella multocida TaxID=747 RepID=UPI00397C98BD
MNNKPTLPQRMWYSLEQAAEKLTRETDEPVTIVDLIHYWLTDRLNISISFCINSLSDEYKIGNLEFNNDFFSKISILTIQDDYFKETEEDIYLFNKKLTYVNRDEEEIIIEGFLNTRATAGKLGSQLETEILKNKGIYFNDLTGFYLTPTTENKEERIAILVDYFFKYLEGWEKVNLNELIILHSDLELFKNHIYNNINLDIPKQPSPRKQNNQIKFIKALIKCHYGKEKPDEVRRLLEHGDLYKDFRDNNIDPIITPETLRNWYQKEF